MEIQLILPLVLMYLAKRQQIKYEISRIRLECQRLVRKSRRYSTLRNYLMTSFFLLNERSCIINRRVTWSYKKMIGGGQKSYH